MPLVTWVSGAHCATKYNEKLRLLRAISIGTLCSTWNLVNLGNGIVKFNNYAILSPSLHVPWFLEWTKTSEAINHHFANICNQLPALKLQYLPSYLPTELSPPTIYSGQVLKALKGLKPSKAGHPSDSLLTSWQNPLPICSTTASLRAFSQMCGKWQLSYRSQRKGTFPLLTSLKQFL